MNVPAKRGRKAGQPTFAAQVDEEGGDEVVIRRIAAGETVAAIMQSYGYARDQWYHWIKAGGDERRARWEEAKRASADALVEDAGSILDGAADATNTAQVTISKARSDYRRWLASCRSEEYRDRSNGAQVVIDLGGLHLDALRKVGQMDQRPVAGPVVEAELLDSGEE